MGHSAEEDRAKDPKAAGAAGGGGGGGPGDKMLPPKCPDGTGELRN